MTIKELQESILKDSKEYNLTSKLEEVSTLFESSNYEESLVKLDAILDHYSDFEQQMESFKDQHFYHYNNAIEYYFTQHLEETDLIHYIPIAMEDIFYRYGLSYYMLYDIDRALACMRMAEKYNPVSCDIQYLHALLLLEDGNIEDCITLLKMSLHFAYSKLDVYRIFATYARIAYYIGNFDACSKLIHFVSDYIEDEDLMEMKEMINESNIESRGNLDDFTSLYDLSYQADPKTIQLLESMSKDVQNDPSLVTELQQTINELKDITYKA